MQGNELKSAEAGQGGSWCDPGRLSWVRVSGADAARFLDNFTTAAVGSVAEGHGCEGFFTDVRGQVICLAGLLRCGPEAGEEPAVEIVADGDVGGALAEHLERYHIREPIEIEDISASRLTIALLGDGIASGLATRAAGSRKPADLTAAFDHALVTLAGTEGTAAVARLVRCDWGGPHGWLLACGGDDADAAHAALTAAGFTHQGSSAWEQARIEAGTPRQCDLLPKTLPQELGRDARAISFTKGCYLGQETVARLDALGHVNRRLVTLTVAGDAVPPAGAAITSGSKTIGEVTSSCLSPSLGKPLALAILPVKAITAEAELTIAGHPAQPHLPEP